MAALAALATPAETLRSLLCVGEDDVKVELDRFGVVGLGAVEAVSIEVVVGAGVIVVVAADEAGSDAIVMAAV